MLTQRLAVRAGLHGPCHCGLGSRARPASRSGVFNIRTQQAGIERSHVSIADHDIGLQLLNTPHSHTCHAPIAAGDVIDLGIVDELGTISLGQGLKRNRQLLHAAFDRPHAGPLHMSNQTQRRRREKRRGTAIGGVAAEELPETRVVKLRVQNIPQGGERLHLPEGSRVGRHNQRQQAGLRRFEKRLLQHVEDIFSATTEIEIVSSFLR